MKQPKLNEWGQPIGETVDGWEPRPSPRREVLVGRYCQMRPVDPSKDAPDLFEAYADGGDGRLWTYLPYGPFANQGEYHAWLSEAARRDDPLFYSIVSAQSGKPVGVASYLRIEPALGVVEVGHLCFSPRLQKTREATESMFLMMKYAFEALGYRRYEWKCDALNEGSRAAALRLGFQFEGVFRQASIYKGRSRDTAWFSVIDSEWPTLNAAFSAWLEPSNFDEVGQQKRALDSFRAVRWPEIEPPFP